MISALEECADGSGDSDQIAKILDSSSTQDLRHSMATAKQFEFIKRRR